jgi:hypothetical protein
MNDGMLGRFTQSFRGPVIEDADSRYDEVRALYNGMIDKRPR